MTRTPVRATDGGPASWVIDGTSRLMSRVGLHSVIQSFAGAVPTGCGPLLYCVNHVSWWDGFLVRRLHKGHRPGPLYTIMLEKELRRRPTLRRAGAIGLDPGSLTATRGAIRFLEGLASDHGSSVCLFPQGRIWPSTRRPLGFEPGVRLFANALGEPWIVPVGIHVEPLNHFRPTAFVLAGQAFPWKKNSSVDRIERAVETLLDGLSTHVERWGESAGERPILDVVSNLDATTINETGIENERA